MCVYVYFCGLLSYYLWEGCGKNCLPGIQRFPLSSNGLKSNKYDFSNQARLLCIMMSVWKIFQITQIATHKQKYI